MSKTEQQIKKIRRDYTEQEIRELFVKRLDDDLFASVGASASPINVQRTAPPHVLVWLGFEKILGINK